jgi:hypothetical protein
MAFGKGQGGFLNKALYENQKLCNCLDDGFLLEEVGERECAWASGHWRFVRAA